MKKRRKIKPIKENIFLFPDVDKLLLDKGLESLQNKKFAEAIDYLEKALELDSYNEEIGLGLIIAYFESGNLIAAKRLAGESLQKGIGDYFQLIDIYIMILLQLNEYEEIVSTLQALIEEKEIPHEKLDNFLNILEFSKRKLESDRLDDLKNPTYDEGETFDLFQYQSLNEQFQVVAKLSERNVRAYLKEIKEYLLSEIGHPFMKTMLLQLLKEQEVNEEINLEKFQQRITVIPTELIEIESVQESIELITILKNNLEHHNPTLYESIRAIVNRHSFLLYPFDRKPNNPDLWAAAYHFITVEYFGESISLENMARKYELEQRMLREAIAYIRELEEISSPFI